MLLLDLNEELLPSSRWLERKLQSVLLSLRREPFEQGFKRGRHWNRERALLSPLWAWECDFTLVEIKTGERNPRFAKPASGIEADLKRDLHPLRFLSQRFANLHDLCVRQFWFFRRPISSDFHA